MAPESPIQLVLVQIQEAHTRLWPLGMVDHPEPQRTLEERMERARAFKATVPFHVVVDCWEDPFERRFHAWPDRYHWIGADLVLRAKSTYTMDAKVESDCADLLASILG